MHPIDKVRILDLPTVREFSRGSLTVLEENTAEWPFEVKRVFFIHDVPDGSIRGGHAHTSNLELLICLSGKVDLKLTDSMRTVDIHLESPDKGVVIPPDVWNDMSGFTNDTILLVLCSEPYDTTGYINNFEDFKNYIKENYDAEDRI